MTPVPGPEDPWFSLISLLSLRSLKRALFSGLGGTPEAMQDGGYDDGHLSLSVTTPWPPIPVLPLPGGETLCKLLNLSACFPTCEMGRITPPTS